MHGRAAESPERASNYLASRIKRIWYRPVAQGVGRLLDTET